MTRWTGFFLGCAVAVAACGNGAVPDQQHVGQFRNPVIASDFADPAILKVGATYFVFATTDGSDNLQAARSTDLVHWSRLADPLPRLPAWQPSTKGYTWAPEVVPVVAGFVMYYTARLAEIGRQCISVAASMQPAGPFEDRSTAPLVCQRDLGGSIDPSRFVDLDGTAYLVWKNDGNCCGIPTDIWAQQLSADGLSLQGEAKQIGLRTDRTWEGNLIEAPIVLLHDHTYFAFYSANGYAGPDYAVGYATSQSLFGPWVKAPENPILKTRAPAAGPGGQAVVVSPRGQLWLAYHAWDANHIGYDANGKRAMWIDRLTLEGGRAVVHGPTAAWQPLP